MSKDQHVVTLNGHLYDAATGKKVAAPASQTKKSAAAKKSGKPGTILDGIAPKASHRTGRTPQKSQTLMRTTVKKPTVIKAERRAAPAPVSKPQESAPLAAQKYPEIIKPKHIIQAVSIPKSALISKFGKLQSSPIKSDVIPVKPAPAQPAGTHRAAAATHASTSPSNHIQQNTAKHDPISAGLAKASSHMNTHPSKPSAYHRLAGKLHVRPSTLTAGVAGLALLVGAGLYAYAKVPAIAMQVAVQKTGIKASLPAYSPAGFSLQHPIDYSSDKISLEYRSNSDERNFKVVQRASSWDSQALLENFVEANHKQYQTMQVNGRTIYTYGDGSASWVDGGTWYQIEGNSNLSSDQLLNIVNGL